MAKPRSIQFDPSLLREAVLGDLSTAVGRSANDSKTTACTSRLVEEWVPRMGGGHVIITTTDSAIPPRASTRVEVGRMAIAEAVDLLRRRLIPAGEPAGPDLRHLVRLAKELERWPLALELASGYLHGTGLGINGIPEYISRLKLSFLRRPYTRFRLIIRGLLYRQ